MRSMTAARRTAASFGLGVRSDELGGTVPCAHQRTQQMRELFAELHDIVTLCLEDLEQGAQMRRRKRRPTAVKWLIAVYKLMHATTEIVRERSVEMRLMVQFFTQ